MTVTVLLVEDLRAYLDLQRTFLGRHEVRILTEAPEGPVAARVLRERPHLVIVDVQPPDRAGLAVCRALRDEAPDVPVVCLIPRTLRDLAEEAGARAVVYKPIVQREFLDTLRRFVPLQPRKGPRYPVNLRFTFEGPAGGGQAFSRDLSSGGVYLKTDRILAPGQRLDLRFRIPGDEAEIVCAGVVRGTEGSGRGVPAGFGVEFRDIAPGDRARLEQFVGGFARRTLAPG